MKKKVYIEMDSVLGTILIHHTDHKNQKAYSKAKEWKISCFDWVDFESILLTVHQRNEALDEDFKGYVPYNKYLKAKDLYENKN